jgi:hypothetical protein
MLLNVDGQKVTVQSVTFAKHKRYIASYVPERKLSLNLKKFKRKTIVTKPKTQDVRHKKPKNTY